MVNSMVERATSDMLIGPDWAMNIEICDMLNHDPGQAKDVVKGIKRRIGSRNSKVQLLSLTLLETVIKNCGDIVHMHVAEKDILHEMVKIVKKKPDFHVKEKILSLIDTWQEAFGGPRARYPQYYAAYQELLRAGAVFPQRSEQAAPVFTPPQTQPLTSFPPNVRNSDYGQETAESSAEAEFPSLSLTEIQNARGIMDVLAEMLNALDPGNKEGLRQEVIVDLVEQCRTYKQRVVHLVNSTADESLLRQGLALNDELQRLLARHESMSSGNFIQTDKLKPEPSGALVDVEGSLVDTGDTPKHPDVRSYSSASSVATQPSLLSLPAAPTTNVTAVPQVKLNTKIDLLSGDDYNSPSASNTLALVSVGEPQPTSPAASQHNALVLANLFPPSNNSAPNSSTIQSTYPQYQQQQNIQSSQSPFYPNGNQIEQSMYAQQVGNPAWNGQVSQQQQQQQPSSPTVYGDQVSGSLPPPPWEAQPTENTQPGTHQTSQMEGPQSFYPQSQNAHTGLYPQGPQPMPNGQVSGGYFPATNNQQIPSNQFAGYQPQMVPGGQTMGMYPQQPIQPGQYSQQQMQPGQYPQQQMQPGQYPQQQMQPGQYPQQQMYGNQMAAYGYNQQQQEAIQLQQRMYELSMSNDNASRNSSYSTSSYVPPSRPSKPEDKLFGDLVDIAKFKPAKT